MAKKDKEQRESSSAETEGTQKVTLASRQFLQGRWHEAGSKVEVADREAHALVARGIVEGDRAEAERNLGASQTGFRSLRRGSRRR